MNTELTLDVLIVHIKKRQVVTVRNTQQLLSSVRFSSLVVGSNPYIRY